VRQLEGLPLALGRGPGGGTADLPVGQRARIGAAQRHGFADPDRVRDTNADRDRDGDTNADRDRDRDANRDCDCDTYTDHDVDTDTNADRVAVAHTDSFRVGIGVAGPVYHQLHPGIFRGAV
jgi:hypothetical protein